MNLAHLRQFPFSLDDDAIAWVEDVISSMSPHQRVAQLFNIALHGGAAGWADKVRELQPGAVTRFFSADGAAEMALIDQIQSEADIPLLVSADLEGSRMSLAFGTQVPNPLALAAIDDVEITRDISRTMAEEARAVGVNWTFTPVLDVNAAFRSPIVATRGYGSDIERIRRHAMTQAEEFQSAGIAACVKHWPGEGYDDRDQHLVTTVNPLSIEKWEATFGSLYRDAIARGVLSVMSAHIAFPAFVRSIDPEAGEAAFRPASLSRHLNLDLLRDRLGFNGVIVSDASEMGGILSIMDEAASKVELLRAGCDMVLFTDDLQGDVENILQAVADGTLEQSRLDDALTRVLGLKAALRLHIASSQEGAGRMAKIGNPDAATRARAAFSRAPTLVKDRQKLFPLDVKTHRKVLFISTDVVSPIHGAPLPFEMPELLRARGFEVTKLIAGDDFRFEDFDLVLYVLGEETLLTRGRIFMDWLRLMGRFGAAMARPWHRVPTAIVSFGYPYYLYDAPNAPAYINTYSTAVPMQEAVLDCMLGLKPFEGVSPIDPFCGLEQTHW